MRPNRGMSNIILAKYMPRGLSRTQKLMAEEVIEVNKDDHQVTILPPLHIEHEGRLESGQMVPYYHWGTGEGCKQVAFYYTHVLEKGEVMMASRALYPNGKRPDRNQSMECGSCGAPVQVKGDLSFYKDRYFMT
jgi:hypothetical protein